MGTALVRSQVLSYLRGLDARGFDTELITFEGGEPFPDGEYPRDRWHGVDSRRGSSLLAKAVDVLRGVLLAVRVTRTRRASLLHARSYIPAAVAAVAGALTRRPYIFDMRGFLGDEYVDAGYWSRTDTRYRVLRVAETLLLRRAAHIVVLTHAAARVLANDPRYARAVGDTPVTVIPCAVDLSRFRPSIRRGDAPTLVYSGTLGSFYELDPMLAVYREARRLLPALRFLILNRTEQEVVREAVARGGLADAPIQIRGADFAEMPALLAGAHVGIALVRQAPSKVASSAVKIAEYLACGLPVVVNSGLGDIDAQVHETGAGHVLASYASEDIALAAQAVVALASDDEARARARALAEREYDLESGIDRYAEVYARLSAASTT